MILIFILLALSIGISVGMLIKQRPIKKLQSELLESNHLNAKLTAQVHAEELSQLRYKLNPHLFKNVLNSIQSHAYQTYYAMDKLSGVLDYVLYDSDQLHVSVRDELAFAMNFIEINRLKLSPLYDLSVKNQIASNAPSYLEWRILPMITIDLIENAFKHADFQQSSSFVAIQFQVIDDWFVLEVRNRISKQEKPVKKRSGLGLSNLKQRLEFAYPEAHQLLFKVEEECYVAILKIRLHE